MTEYIPKPVFDVLEAAHFYWKKDGVDKAADWAKKNVPNLTYRIQVLLEDISIVLDSHKETLHSHRAFLRYSTFYKGMDSQELYDYGRFLISTFGPFENKDQRQNTKNESSDPYINIFK